jgi:hypothetical protein
MNEDVPGFVNRDAPIVGLGTTGLARFPTSEAGWAAAVIIDATVKNIVADSRAIPTDAFAGRIRRDTIRRQQLVAPFPRSAAWWIATVRRRDRRPCA